MQRASPPVEFWHRRYVQQASWTRQVRAYLYEISGLESARRVLDVGCGTGALLPELQDRTTGAIHGLDISPANLAFAHAQFIHAVFTQADAHHLPYQEASFDSTLCHFLLLWLPHPEQAVAEMRRVTRPGGSLLLLAEPDYEGRIDYPAELSQLGAWQTASLKQQGAGTRTGRQLAAFLAGAGLVNVAGGVLGGYWSGPPGLQDWETEWAVLEHDLNKTSAAQEAADIFQKQLAELRELDWQAWQAHARVLFVPTFYAWGIVPG